MCFLVPELLAKLPVLTGVKSGMLLHMTKLLEAAVAVRTLVGLLSRVDTDVLDQLMVGRE
jgi:hypothetical protein